MIPEAVTNYVDCLEPYLVPDSGNFEDIRPALTALALPYEVEPWRFHHTIVNHLQEKAAFLIEHVDSLQFPEVVFGASPGHDVPYYPWLYNPSLGVRGVNEIQASHLTQQLFQPHFKTWVVSRMGSYIEATAGHPNDVEDGDLAHFLDSDMLVLGSAPDRFERYEADICSEFTWLGNVTRKQYLLGRLAFFNSQKDKRIFCTEVAQDLHEAQAHQNIAEMKHRHEAELAQL